jgi:hypothetical protein
MTRSVETTYYSHLQAKKDEIDRARKHRSLFQKSNWYQGLFLHVPLRYCEHAEKYYETDQESNYRSRLPRHSLTAPL